jgi:hypothetical protein
MDPLPEEEEKLARGVKSTKLSGGSSRTETL